MSFDKHTDERPIFLVGFMGAGKTTVGRALAERLEYRFFDLDDQIAARAGKSVQAIFAELGESEFRQLERDLITSHKNDRRTVVALGGGAYVSEANRVLLRAIGKTVWLDCPLEVCLRRISEDGLRPLVGNPDEMAVLLEQRRPAYAQTDYVIRAGERAPAELVQEIVTLLGGR